MTNPMDQYRFGGTEREPVNILRLISELEGSYTLLHYMAFEEDRDVIREMCNRYYKEYFRLKKLERTSKQHEDTTKENQTPTSKEHNQST